MDVCGVYVGDSNLAMGNLRSPYYRDYEQFPYGTLENHMSPVRKDSYTIVQEKRQQTMEVKVSKKDCPFCKEQKKRPLTARLRALVLGKKNESICEEAEEYEEGNEEHTHAEEHHEK